MKKVKIDWSDPEQVKKYRSKKAKEDRKQIMDVLRKEIRSAFFLPRNSEGRASRSFYRSDTT